MKDKFSLTERKRENYQLYDKVTFEEVDDTSNYQLQEIPQKFLYETNRVKRYGSKRIYLAKTKDYTADSSITISVLNKTDLEDDFRKEIGYFHIAAIQILVKWLGNAGIDIPIKIAIRDERITDTQKSILGLWTSNLYTGAIYTVLYMDYMFSALDKNIDQLLTVYVKPTIDLLEGSKAVSISTKLYMSWVDVPHPFRKRDSMYNKERLAQGKTIVIKSTGMDVRSIPQPIPIEKLTWDLEFEFPRTKRNLHIGESTEVEYMFKTNQGLQVRLKPPVTREIGSSSSTLLNKYTDNLDDETSDGETEQSS